MSDINDSSYDEYESVGESDSECVDYASDDSSDLLEASRTDASLVQSVASRSQVIAQTHSEKRCDDVRRSHASSQNTTCQLTPASRARSVTPSHSQAQAAKRRKLTNTSHSTPQCNKYTTREPRVKAAPLHVAKSPLAGALTVLYKHNATPSMLARLREIENQCATGTADGGNSNFRSWIEAATLLPGTRSRAECIVWREPRALSPPHHNARYPRREPKTLTCAPRWLVVGYVLINYEASSDDLEMPVSGAHIAMLGVDPQYRGRGIGTRLLRRAKEAASQRSGNVTLLVDDKNPAVTLYRREGFVKYANYQAASSHEFWMVCSL